MKRKKALQIAIKAMELQKRRHACNWSAYHAGCIGSKGEAKRYEEYGEAIEVFSGLLDKEDGE